MIASLVCQVRLQMSDTHLLTLSHAMEVLRCHIMEIPSTSLSSFMNTKSSVSSGKQHRLVFNQNQYLVFSKHCARHQCSIHHPQLSACQKSHLRSSLPLRLTLFSPQRLRLAAEIRNLRCLPQAFPRLERCFTSSCDDTHCY